MKLKIILITFVITISACFYFQSQQILELRNRVETLEAQGKKADENFKTIDTIFRIIIKEIEKTSKFIA
jgi:hypothetical protein